MYKTVYALYTYQYTWKVTVKDFIIGTIAGLQLKTLLKMCFFIFKKISICYKLLCMEIF